MIRLPRWSLRNNTSYSFFDNPTTQRIVPSDTVLVGLCTGSLAAAAVAASQSTPDLVENALNIVRVAFRIGTKVNNAAQRLSTGVNQKWSQLVLDAQEEASVAEIKQFMERKVSEVCRYLILYH